MKMVVYLSRTASVSVTHPEWITSGQKPNREGVPINARLGMVSVLQWPGSQIKQSKAIQINRLSPSTCLMNVILMQALVIDDEKPDSPIEEWVPQISRSFSYWQIIGSQLNQPGEVCMAGISWQPDLKPQGGGNSR